MEQILIKSYQLPTRLPIPIIQTGLVYVDEQIVYMLTATIYI